MARKKKEPVPEPPVGIIVIRVAPDGQSSTMVYIDMTPEHIPGVLRGQADAFVAHQLSETPEQADDQPTEE
jgi:hypothetical protein